MSTFLWDDAKCIGKFALFFSTKYDEIYHATRLCRTCPHKQECKEMGRSEHYGVWGGEYHNFHRSSVRKYHIWLKKKEAKDDVLEAARKLGVDVEQFKRVVGL